MNKTYVFFIILVGILTLFFPIIIFGLNENSNTTSSIPIGLQKIQEYQDQQSYFYLKNISIIIAFLGGILSFLLPCTFAILPAFFAYTFREKRDLTKMTFTFFLGFALVFTIFGLIAALVGKSISSFRVDNRLMVSIAGIFLILLGFMSIFGKGFSSLIKQKKYVGHDKFGTFLFGMLFAVGWSACLGPILAGIMLIASTFKSYFISSLLLFSYSLGIFLPLFIVSFFYDKHKLGDKAWIKGKIFTIGKYELHTTNLISGLLLVISGVVFIIYSGTSIVQETIVLGTGFVYEIERGIYQIPYINWIGFLILLTFIFFLYKFLYKDNPS